MNTIRKAIAGGALVATTLAGGAIGASFVNATAGAATSPTATTATTAPTAGQPTQGQAPDGQRGRGGTFDPSKGGHQANGKTETLLTGDTAAKVKAAALAAVPGGTVERVETDAEGAAYEAHVKKADGSEVTLKFDASFKVTSTLQGPG